MDFLHLHLRSLESPRLSCGECSVYLRRYHDCYLVLVDSQESDMSEDNGPLQHPEWQDYLETTPSLSYVDTSSKPSSASPLPPSPSQPAQQPAIRTEIDQLAVKYQLGKVQKEYKNEVSTNMSVGISFCILGLLCFLPFILDVFVQLGYFSGLRLTFIIGLGFLGYGINRISVAINNIGGNVLNYNPRCYLSPHGVISIKRK